MYKKLYIEFPEVPKVHAMSIKAHQTLSDVFDLNFTPKSSLLHTTHSSPL